MNNSQSDRYAQRIIIVGYLFIAILIALLI